MTLTSLWIISFFVGIHFCNTLANEQDGSSYCLSDVTRRNG